MIVPVVLIFGTLLGAAALGIASKPGMGMGAFDVLPPGFSGKPVGNPIPVQTKSGRKYHVSGWRPVNGETYQVAVLDRTPSTWIAYFSNKSTGRRRLFRAAAGSPAERDAMMSDFGVGA